MKLLVLSAHKVISVITTSHFLASLYARVSACNIVGSLSGIVQESVLDYYYRTLNSHPIRLYLAVLLDRRVTPEDRHDNLMALSGMCANRGILPIACFLDII